MRACRLTQGSTLIEILIAVAFLALAAVAILDAVQTAHSQSAYALRRARVFAALQDQLEIVRGIATSGTLASSVKSTNLNLPGLGEPLTVTVTVAQIANSRVLFDVSAAGSWVEEYLDGTRVDAATLTTIVRDL